METTIKEIKRIAKSLCDLHNRDRYYFPDELQVSNNWNGVLKGFFADGEMIVYIQGDSTDCDVPTTLSVREFSVHSHCGTAKFTTEQVERFILNLVKEYSRCQQPEVKNKLELHKLHDNDIHRCIKEVVDMYWDRLRLKYYDFMGNNPNYDHYKRIEKAIYEYKAAHFFEICDMSHEQIVAQFKAIAAQTK